MLPASFAKVSTTFTESGLLDLSGPGLLIPDVKQDDQKYCGPVYLIATVDGAGVGKLVMKTKSLSSVRCLKGFGSTTPRD